MCGTADALYACGHKIRWPDAGRPCKSVPKGESLKEDCTGPRAYSLLFKDKQCYECLKDPMKEGRAFNRHAIFMHASEISTFNLKLRKYDATLEVCRKNHLNSTSSWPDSDSENRTVMSATTTGYRCTVPFDDKLFFEGDAMTQIQYAVTLSMRLTATTHYEMDLVDLVEMMPDVFREASTKKPSGGT